jgi:hypothetical protein
VAYVTTLLVTTPPPNYLPRFIRQQHSPSSVYCMTHTLTNLDMILSTTKSTPQAIVDVSLMIAFAVGLSHFCRLQPSFFAPENCDLSRGVHAMVVVVTWRMNAATVIAVDVDAAACPASVQYYSLSSGLCSITTTALSPIVRPYAPSHNILVVHRWISLARLLLPQLLHSSFYSFFTATIPLVVSLSLLSPSTMCSVPILRSPTSLLR